MAFTSLVYPRPPSCFHSKRAWYSLYPNRSAIVTKLLIDTDM